MKTKFLKSFYLTQEFFYSAAALVFFSVVSFFIPILFPLVQAAFLVLLILTASDAILLYRPNRTIDVKRQMPRRLSNGDVNIVQLVISNHYGMNISAGIIDEIPIQFQDRSFYLKLNVAPGEKRNLTYELRPLSRGEYNFGKVHIFVKSPLRLVNRRISADAEFTVPVYPSWLQMNKYELLGLPSLTVETGVKKIRRIGHSLEFEQIKEYVQGDDYRTINWKATARRSNLMVNHYDEEKSQLIYNVINMGRVMKMPFNGLSLLDYAINTSLVLSKIALQKHDKAGIVTFSSGLHSMLPADGKITQIQKILDLLYKQTTDFRESDYESLCAALLSKIKHRSLIVLYTNFESMSSMKRQLEYLRRLAVYHLVLVVFFENTELEQLMHKESKSTEDIYLQALAEQFIYEKRQIVLELNRHKIATILTKPEQLTVNTINRYLEIKAKNLL